MIIYVTDSNVLRRNKRKGNENEIKTVDNGPLVFLTTELLDNLSQESRLYFYIFPLLLKTLRPVVRRPVVFLSLLCEANVYILLGRN